MKDLDPNSELDFIKYLNMSINGYMYMPTLKWNRILYQLSTYLKDKISDRTCGYPLDSVRSSTSDS